MDEQQPSLDVSTEPGRDDPWIPPPGTRLTGQALGIDVGGTGVKAALVDLATGSLISDRIREKTPHPATWSATSDVINSVVGRVLADREVPEDLPVGCGLPGVVKFGRLVTHANIDPDWTTVSAEEAVGERIGRRVIALNDADAAGIAELTYGAAGGRAGTVIVIVVGTGIGTALFIDGRLVPNTELGHIELNGKDAESRLSGAARERRGLSWKTWGRGFSEYLARIEAYLWPDLIILGGGVSKEIAKFESQLQTRAPLVAAHFLNTAGIIGAAFAAASALQAGASSGPGAPGAALDTDPATIGAVPAQSGAA